MHGTVHLRWTTRGRFACLLLRQRRYSLCVALCPVLSVVRVRRIYLSGNLIRHWIAPNINLDTLNIHFHFSFITRFDFEKSRVSLQKSAQSLAAVTADIKLGLASVEEKACLSQVAPTIILCRVINGAPKECEPSPSSSWPSPSSSWPSPSSSWPSPSHSPPPSSLVAAPERYFGLLLEVLDY